MSEMVRWSITREHHEIVPHLYLYGSNATYSFYLTIPERDRVLQFSHNLIDLDLFMMLWKLFADATVAFMGSVQ